MIERLERVINNDKVRIALSVLALGGLGAATDEAIRGYLDGNHKLAVAQAEVKTACAKVQFDIARARLVSDETSSSLKTNGIPGFDGCKIDAVKAPPSCHQVHTDEKHFNQTARNLIAVTDHEMDVIGASTPALREEVSENIGMIISNEDLQATAAFIICPPPQRTADPNPAQIYQ